jgi:hypothetical protein
MAGAAEADEMGVFSSSALPLAFSLGLARFSLPSSALLMLATVLACAALACPVDVADVLLAVVAAAVLPGDAWSVRPDGRDPKGRCVDAPLGTWLSDCDGGGVIGGKGRRSTCGRPRCGCDAGPGGLAAVWLLPNTSWVGEVSRTS